MQVIPSYGIGIGAECFSNWVEVLKEQPSLCGEGYAIYYGQGEGVCLLIKTAKHIFCGWSKIDFMERKLQHDLNFKDD